MVMLRILYVHMYYLLYILYENQIKIWEFFALIFSQTHHELSLARLQESRL